VARARIALELATVAAECKALGRTLTSTQAAAFQDYARLLSSDRRFPLWSTCDFRDGLSVGKART